MTGYAIPPRTWPAEPVDAPHPAPEVPQRPADALEVPAGAARLQRAAEGAGWRVSVTYARGTAVDARGRPGKLVHSVALRLRSPDLRLRAVAVYVTPAESGVAKCENCWVWRTGTLPRPVNVTQLRAYLVDPESFDAAVTTQNG